MSSLVVLAIIAFFILYKAGPAKRADWKHQIGRALAPELDRVRDHPSMPERFRTKPTANPIIGRSTTTPPPPTGRPVSTPPKRRVAAPPPPTGAPLPPMFQRSSLPPPSGEPVVAETTIEHETPPAPDEPIVVVPAALPDPVIDDPVVDDPADLVDDDPHDDVPDETKADETLASPPAVDEAAATPDDVDLERDAVIAALFGRSEPAHVRAASFAESYAGREVTWQATLVRTAKGRRHREPATRAELVLGYTSERQMFSERVVAEAYFGPDVELERDSEITVCGVLAEANVYANRVVLDHVEIV
ncbi:MAG: hypothetical protein AAGE98_11705 [Actinomycetota bacterium]